MRASEMVQQLGNYRLCSEVVEVEDSRATSPSGPSLGLPFDLEGRKGETHNTQTR
jgi:hypothetical protein